MNEHILEIFNKYEFEQIGFVPHTNPLSFSFYKSWVEEGYHADMDYLKDHLYQKQNLNHYSKKARSTFIITKNYFNHPYPLKSLNLKVASYAKGVDYHLFFKKELEDVLLELKTVYPNDEFIFSTDSRPILERDFAYQAGLGWFGKNTLLIHQSYGSYFFIAEIVTSLDPKSLNSDLQTQEPHPDRCGTCTKCIEACPTEALSPKKLDSNKCISYWTIESKKKLPPLDLAHKFQGWFFGCDICQDVCPWNIKKHGLKDIAKKNHIERADTLNEVLDILMSSNKSLEKRFSNSPLSRARGFGLKRNALIVALNLKAIEIKDKIKKIDFKDPNLNSFKEYVLQNLEQDDKERHS